MPRRWLLFVYLGTTVVVIAGLKYAGPFLVPVLFGATLAAVSSPIATWVTRHGLPSVAGALVAVLLDAAILGLMGLVVVLAGGELQEKVPIYLARVSEGLDVIAVALTRKGIPVDAGALGGELHMDKMMPLVGGAAVTIVDAVTTLVVVLLVAFFGLCEIVGLGDKIHGALVDPERTFVRVDRIVREIQRYLAIKMLTSLIVACFAFALLKLLRVELALLLTLLLFLLHFVPNIGAAVATVPAVAVALVSRGPGTAAMVGVGYFLINMLVGNVFEPRVLGKSLGLSPLMVFLGMLFWGWLWGPAGALLSVPLMMIGKIVLENTRDLAWIARLAEPAQDAAEVTSPGRRSLTSIPIMSRPSVPIGLGSSGRNAKR
ncbi:MAG: AI-2E family transporter [Minicystis sp.]